MATPDEQTTNACGKKKNTLRSRFSTVQRSLDISTSSMTTGSQPSLCETLAETHVKSSKKSNGKGLFRRSRSEDRMKNIRISNAPLIGQIPQQSVMSDSIHPTPPTPSVSVETPQQAANRFPASPPPPYDNYSSEDSGHSTMRQSPPSYDEVMRTTGDQILQNGNRLENGVTYCPCVECQQRRYADTDDEDRNGDASDVVFPMETHVLMQEVLADGMAFCSIM